MTSLVRELKAVGIFPQKGLGQHFLADKNIAQKIVGLAPLEPDDVVVEIGPGMGVLTFLLIRRVRKVVAVELDRRMVDYLNEKGEGMTSLVVVHDDALRFDFQGLAQEEGRKLKAVANLPYNISTPLIFRFLENREAFSHLTLMLQREVAQRITTPPGDRDYGALSIFVQLYTLPQILMRVPSSAFYPRPKVESALVGFEILEHPRVEIGDEGFFREVVRASFAQRRKTILNSLKNSSLPLGSREGIKGALQSVNIDPRRRAETLGLVEFQRLAEALRGLVSNGNNTILQGQLSTGNSGESSI